MIRRPRGRMALAVLLLVVSVGQNRAQTPGTIRRIELQHFDRFWRVAFYLDRRIPFAAAERQPRVLTLQVEANLADSLTLPANEAVRLGVDSTDAPRRFIIDLPQPFKSDVFYFPPGQKLVVDCYPLMPFSSATQAYEAARRALLQRDTTQAVLLYRTALLQDPNLKNAVFRLAEIYLARNDAAAAQRALVQVDSTARLDLQLKARALLDSLMRPAPAKTELLASSEPIIQPDSSDNPTAEVETAAPDSAAEASPSLAKKSTPQPIIVSRRKLPTGPLAWFRKALAEWGVLALIPLIATASLVGFFFWFLALRPTKKEKMRRDTEEAADRVLELLQKNPIYRRRKALDREREESPATAVRRRGIDLRDTVDEATPFGRETRRPSGAAAPRRRIVTRSGTGSDGAPAKGTPDRSSMKREVVRLALKGRMVTEIARELDIGVGEVELILGFGAGTPTTPENDESLDFGV